MLFSSIPFLFYFLPCVFVLYFLVPMRWKNTMLLLASLFFYAWGEPKFVVFMLASIVQGYVLARLVEKYRADRRRAKLFLTLSLVFSLGLLGYCKYADFFLSGFNALTGLHIPLLRVALPIGISFYTFQILSYVVDVYRGDVKAQRNFIDLAAYIAMFPQLIAGPIVRYSDIASQLEHRTHSLADIAAGARRFVLGLGKKVLLANVFYELITTFKASDDRSVLFYWLYAAACVLNIYFDFSGYSDMAIGLGRIFGFRYCENFDLPYISTSITEFWRRWHMSLGSFFRDYVYIPLGGNRRGKARQILNLLAVWALTGLWHGASWNFVLWGLYFFVLLSIEKQIAPKLETLPFIVRNLVTMFFVLIGWVLFMNTSLSGIGSAFAAMFGGGTSFAGSGVSLQLKNSLPLLLTCLIGSSVLPRWFGFIWSGLFGMGRSDRRGAVTVKKGIYLASVFLFLILLLWLCTVSLVGSTSSPSMYAQF